VEIKNFHVHLPRKIIGIIRNTDKKHKGTATAAVGTFGARKAGAGDIFPLFI
jgi:hypothetical protein